MSIKALEAAARRWQTRAAKYDPAPGRDHEEGETMRQTGKPSGFGGGPGGSCGRRCLLGRGRRGRGPAGPVRHIRRCER